MPRRRPHSLTFDLPAAKNQPNGSDQLSPPDWDSSFAAPKSSDNAPNAALGLEDDLVYSKASPENESAAPPEMTLGKASGLFQPDDLLVQIESPGPSTPDADNQDIAFAPTNLATTQIELPGQFSNQEGNSAWASAPAATVSVGALPSAASLDEQPDWSFAQIIDNLLRKKKFWPKDDDGNVVVTYSFPQKVPKDYEDLAELEKDGISFTDAFQPLNDGQIEAVQQAFAVWSQVANIVFKKVEDGQSGQIRLANSGEIVPFVGGGAAQPPGDGKGGDIWFNADEIPTEVKLGSNPFYLILHEIGHAIGLSHPGDYDADVEGISKPEYETHAEYKQDSQQYTVMSYFDPWNTGADHETVTDGEEVQHYTSTPMIHDIAAIQLAYGTNNLTRTGDTVYGYNSTTTDVLTGYNFYNIEHGDHPVFTIWDGAGIDRLDLSGSTSNNKVDLHELAFSDVEGLIANVSIAKGVTIENAFGGAGDDHLTGNTFNNLLRGGSGNDVIYGQGEADYDLAPFLTELDDDELHGERGEDDIFGGNGNDEIWGGDDDDRLFGEDGDDIVWGGRHQDVIVGGEGEDILSGEDGDDIIYGHLETPQAPSDPFWENDDVDKIYGGAGNDTLYGGSGGDTIYGDGTYELHSDKNTGDDLIYGEAGDDTLLGENGNDYIYGGLGDDFANGGDGKDHLFGEQGDDILEAGDDNDVLSGGTGFDFFDGGKGNDTVDYTYSSLDWTVMLASEAAVSIGEYLLPEGFDGEKLISIENVIMGSGSDTVLGTDKANKLWGNDGVDTMFGEAGDDMLDGGNNNDVLHGGEGRDELRGGAGLDTLFGDENEDELFGDAGDDALFGGDDDDILTGGAGLDWLDGGDGFDTADYTYSDLDWSVDLGAQYAASSEFTIPPGGPGETVVNIEAVIMGGGNDTVVGTAVANTLVGGDGIDTLFGLGGSDLLEGGDGDDFLYGGDANDTLIGGLGYDLLSGGEGNDRFVFTSYADGLDQVFGGAEFDTADFSGIAEVGVQVNLGADGINARVGDPNSGGSFALAQLQGIERVIGTEQADVLEGTAFYDNLEGGGGDDIFHAHQGVNIIFGGEGEDIAIYDGNLNEYSISSPVEGLTIVSRNDGSLMDQVIDVETLRFDDIDIIA